MKFIDEVSIEVSSGNGGNGLVAFRREKFVPLGGPAGGDGGRGGDVIFEATDNMTTLYEFSFARIHKAQNGEHGRAKNQFGANGSDLILKVPVGTLIYDADTGQLLVDLAKKKQQATIAKGGRGGRGNARFVSSVRQSPRIAEKGEPGQTLKLKIELKLLADVGLVGLPNAGKSTFLRSVSNARPRVADYPFTTLYPSLGIVKPEGLPSFCMADIPGLIEGAHEGAGLGVQFLKHIERTRLLIHLVDMNEIDMEFPLASYDVIKEELRGFSEDLINKPVVVVANKLDLPDARELFKDFQAALAERGITAFPISAATREGVEDLLKHISEQLQKLKPVDMADTDDEEKLYEYLAPYEIIEQSPRYWLIKGAEIERVAAMTDFTNDQAIALFLRKLKRMGFIDELMALALEEDETIAIGEMEFEYQEFF